ncbi:MAG: flavin monoamine oxidase family protein [Rhizobiaceae bacterium]
MRVDSVCDVAIVGGGLAGLTCASVLSAQGHDARIYEATQNIGGRIQSLRAPQSRHPLADLGPTWVWPPYQSAVNRWLERLDIQLFAQFETGHAVLDLQGEPGPRQQVLPGQHGMSRIVGGPQTFVDRLSQLISPHQICTGRRLTVVEWNKERFTLYFENHELSPVHAKKIVIAAPLRCMAQYVEWNGILNDQMLDIMRSAPTWMAKQTKVVIAYSKPFWRDAGLSGRVASQLGPLSEIHDHCSADGQYAALFGFVGWPERYRDSNQLQQDVRHQLERCFGQAGADYRKMHICDWSENRDICSQIDDFLPAQHPQPLPAVMCQLNAEENIAFANAETGSAHPGLIDGALESGERAAQVIIASASNS